MPCRTIGKKTALRSQVDMPVLLTTEYRHLVGEHRAAGRKADRQSVRAHILHDNVIVWKPKVMADTGGAVTMFQTSGSSEKRSRHA